MLNKNIFLTLRNKIFIFVYKLVIFSKKKKKWIFFLSIASIVVSLLVTIPILVIKNEINEKININIKDKEKSLNFAIVKNNKIVGKNFTSFVEDKFKNLWTIGYGTKLQVYDKKPKKMNILKLLNKF